MPGSPIRENAIKTEKMMPDDSEFDSLSRKKVLGSSQLSPEELVKLRNKAVKQFYLRPSYLLRRLMNINNVECLAIQVREMLELTRKAWR